MKILQLIYESLGSPFGFGGAGVRAYEIYIRLKDRHDVTLLCMKYPGAKDGEIEGLKHLFSGTESKSLTKSVLAYVVNAANFIKKYGRDFDVIVENFLPSTPFFSRLLTKTPVILQVQGIMEKHSLRKFSPFYSMPMYIVERFYPGLYDKFIFVSGITRENVISRIRKKVHFSKVIPNGIDKRLLNVDSKEGDYILFLSRIDIYTKGLDILIEAFRRISPEYPDSRLILAGYEFDRFDKLISGIPVSLKEKIEYAGFVTGEEKIKLLSGAKLFVLPSRHESAPVSILEAAACGKPVIVSDIPELKFVSGGGFGLGFPSGSASGLAEKMGLLLKDKKMRKEMGGRGREYAGRYLWDGIALQFEDTLKSFTNLWET
ncbi:MAG: glycosyltransferase family 4 protein [Nitrospirae bacterium]|nr:glycosyltransferase family 4 protein [Nitrospirota bacterium]